MFSFTLWSFYFKHPFNKISGWHPGQLDILLLTHENDFDIGNVFSGGGQNISCLWPNTLYKVLISLCFMFILSVFLCNLYSIFLSMSLLAHTYTLKLEHNIFLTGNDLLNVINKYACSNWTLHTIYKPLFLLTFCNMLCMVINCCDVFFLEIFLQKNM